MLVFNQFQLSKSIDVNIEEHYSKHSRYPHSRYPRGGVGAARLRPRVRGEVRAAAGCGTWLLTALGTRPAPTLDRYYLRQVDCSVLGPPLSISRRRIHQNPALCSKGYYHRCQFSQHCHLPSSIVLSLLFLLHLLGTWEFPPSSPSNGEERWWSSGPQTKPGGHLLLLWPQTQEPEACH